LERSRKHPPGSFTFAVEFHNDGTRNEPNFFDGCGRNALFSEEPSHGEFVGADPNIRANEEKIKKRQAEIGRRRPPIGAVVGRRGEKQHDEPDQGQPERKKQTATLDDVDFRTDRKRRNALFFSFFVQLFPMPIHHPFPSARHGKPLPFALPPAAYFSRTRRVTSITLTLTNAICQVGLRNCGRHVRRRERTGSAPRRLPRNASRSTS